MCRRGECAGRACSTVTHTIRRTHDLTSSHIRETHITGGGGRRISGGHDETATRLLGSATRLGSSSASPRLGSASPLLSPRLCIAPVTCAAHLVLEPGGVQLAGARERQDAGTAKTARVEHVA